MAGRSKTITDTSTESVYENAAVNDTVTEKINFDEKITVRNIAPWLVGWNKIESNGEVNINPYGSMRITRAEYISKFENGNKLICGTGNGEHATVVTEDKAVRKYLEITAPILKKEYTKKIFEIKGIVDFENKIKDTFVTRAEKLLLIEHIKECKFNDHNKIRICELHCGMSVF